ncbi:MAG TPA: cytochrome P450 [Nocardioidaceae bacterium]|nr:cytochrome P450 [Nocardioidaceae bacterium]
MTNETRPFSPHRVTGLDFWAATAEEREATYKLLRDEDPVSWHPPMEGSLMPPENDGVWVVTRHADIQEVSKNPTVFCSGEGFQFEEVPADILEAAGSFLGMDAPRHPAMRRLISSAFTPKQVKKIEEQIKDQARRIVDELLENPEGDFVAQVSKRLPMWTIYEMVGLEDQDKREEAAHHADGMVSWADEEVAAGREPGEVLNESLVALLMMGMELAEERRTNPKADLFTNLVQAEVDGQKLSDEEIGSFFVLLSVAGNDTTRNSISLGIRELLRNPEQKALLLSDFDKHIGTAIEEIVRFVSPVMTFRRTATEDYVLNGKEIKAGEWVATIFSSGNRDDSVFENPDVFDITRSPNPHLGFGGGGPHFCMGNFVAKMQLREILHNVLHRAPTLEFGEPEFLVGNFVHAVKSLPYKIG